MGLDEAAVAAVGRWRFEPGIYQGHPVDVQVNIEINFRLSALESAASTPPTSTFAVATSRADALYSSGQFAQAAESYRSVLRQDPKSFQATAGLIRSNLKQQKVEEAFDIAKAALQSQPEAATLHWVMGDVRFRRGEMVEAEQEYHRAIKIDPKQAHAYLGLARLYTSFSLYRRAYDLLNQAHEIDPQDSEVQRAWFRMLPRQERIQAIKRYLASPHPDDEEETQSLQRYLAFLEASESQPAHSCRLVNRLASTETPLEPMMIDARRIHGWGLNVVVNGQKSRLLLDTGASGLLIGRKHAERAGVVRISQDQVSGVGDKGPMTGYIGYARSIQVGELEFHDCIVRVSDRTSVVEDDGLIGADVFSSYLVDIDFPGRRLKLSSLPKPPGDDNIPPSALDTTGEHSSTKSERTVEDTPALSTPPRRLPQDRYVAPEMQSWTKVFRFGHLLLVPTLVNGGAPRLFVLDTGAFNNILSTATAKEVTNMAEDYRSTVKGVSGGVKTVYRADKATLQFGHFKQENENVLTLDLSKLSQQSGTEISGALGFAMLNLLNVRIDYRDGLVDFAYDAKRAGF